MNQKTLRTSKYSLIHNNSLFWTNFFCESKAYFETSVGQFMNSVQPVYSNYMKRFLLTQKHTNKKCCQNSWRRTPMSARPFSESKTYPAIVLSNSQLMIQYELILESQTYSSRYVHVVQFTNICELIRLMNFYAILCEFNYYIYNTKYIVFKKLLSSLFVFFV